MEARKLKEAASCLRDGIGETAIHLLDDYPANAAASAPTT